MGRVHIKVEYRIGNTVVVAEEEGDTVLAAFENAVTTLVGGVSANQGRSKSPLYKDFWGAEENLVERLLSDL